MKALKNNNGSAIILTIMMAGVIITVGLGFNWLVKEHLKAAEEFKRKSEAILRTRSAFETISFLLSNGQMGPREMRLSGNKDLVEMDSFPLDGQKIALFKDEDLFVQLQDSNGLLSLTNMNLGAMENLVDRVGGLDNESAIGIIASYLDWIDPDDLVRVNGAESSYYKWGGKPYSARNYPIQFKKEFAWIKGVGSPLYQKIAPYITILPVTGFNPNTASDPILVAYLGLTDENLKILKNYLIQKPVVSNTELFALTGHTINIDEDKLPFFPSPFLAVTVSSGRPRNLYTIHAGLDIRQNMNAPYSIIYWEEE
jgi:general secretion pathway protein K